MKGCIVRLFRGSTLPVHTSCRLFTSVTTSSSSSSSSFHAPPPLVSGRRVVITGMGCVTAVGVGMQNTWDALIAGKSGLKTIDNPSLTALNLPVTIAAPISPEFFVAKQHVPPHIMGLASNYVQYAVASASMALKDANYTADTEEQQSRAGVAIGSGIGSVEDAYEAGQALHTRGPKRVSAYTLPRMLVNLAAGQVSIQHKLRGPNHAVATACATGAHALGDAYRFIKYGDADVMVAGGSEAGVSPISLALFSKIHALSRNSDPTTASRPFDGNRDGFVMGEGAGVVVLEALDHALSRHARIYAEVVGYGLSGDAHHVTSPPPDGAGALACMKAALHSAGLQPSDIDYINAHATSTPVGDAVECIAIKRLFGGTNPSISSIKGAMGHMLGAAGAVEAMVSALSTYHDLIPPTLGLETVDPAIAALGLHIVKGTPESKPVKFALSNSFGFGGTNACLILKKYAKM